MELDSIILEPLLDWRQDSSSLPTDADADARQVVQNWRNDDEEKEVGNYNSPSQVASLPPSNNVNTPSDSVDRVVYVGLRAPRGKNDWFRDICRGRFAEYRAAPQGPAGKWRITMEIIEMVLDQGGRFIYHDSQTEMGYSDIIDKVQSTFRCIAKCHQRRRTRPRKKKQEEKRARLHRQRILAPNEP